MSALFQPTPRSITWLVRVSEHVRPRAATAHRARLCRRGDGQFAFRENRDNPHVLTGAIVGGPDATDAFKDVRGEYHYTEVALDYNTGLTSALAAMAAVPPAFWEVDCAAHVLNYPWP